MATQLDQVNPDESRTSAKAACAQTRDGSMCFRLIDDRGWKQVWVEMMDSELEDELFTIFGSRSTLRIHMLAEWPNSSRNGAARLEW